MATKKLQILDSLIKQPDWNQTDETQSDYIKNKPKTFVRYDRDSLWTPLNEGTVVTTDYGFRYSSDEPISSRIVLSGTFSIREGSELSWLGSQCDGSYAIGDNSFEVLFYINGGVEVYGRYRGRLDPVLFNATGFSFEDLSGVREFSGTSLIDIGVESFTILKFESYQHVPGDIEVGIDLSSNITIDTKLSEISENPVQNKVIATELEKIPVKSGETMGFYIYSSDIANKAFYLSSVPRYNEDGSENERAWGVKDSDALDQWFSSNVYFDGKKLSEYETGSNTQFVAYDIGVLYTFFSRIDTSKTNCNAGYLVLDIIPEYVDSAKTIPLTDNSFEDRLASDKDFIAFAPLSPKSGTVLLYNNQLQHGYGVAVGNAAVTVGGESKAIGNYSFAAGRGNTTGYGAAAFGFESIAYGNHSMVAGTNCETGIDAQDAFAQGWGTKATARAAHSIGYLTKANGKYSHAEGTNSVASANNAHAEGNTTTASGEQSHSEGRLTVAGGLQSHAEGYKSSVAEGATNGHAEGSETKVLGAEGHAEGALTTAHRRAHAEGLQTIAETYSHAEGVNTHSVGQGAHTEGNSTSTNGKSAHAEGTSSAALAAEAHAEGFTTQATGSASHSEGSQTHAGGAASHAEGISTLAVGNYSHAEGNSSSADGVASHAEGSGTNSLGDYSHAEGFGTKATSAGTHAEGDNTTASGIQAHAEGNGTTASGSQAHAEGYHTTASGNRSHAEGFQTVALNYAHAEGANTQANGIYSHTEGNGTIASGESSHAEGASTVASGKGSHAEGLNNTQATAQGAHAEGNATNATAVNAHAEGNGTTASGSEAHAEGWGTTASGPKSHAEGHGSQALGKYSHAEGLLTIAKAQNQHVSGKYNIEDPTGGINSEGTYVHIVGNGKDTNNRSNAHTIDWDGNAWFAGKVTIGSGEELATKAYVDGKVEGLASEAYVNNAINNMEIPEGIVKTGTAEHSAYIDNGSNNVASASYAFAQGREAVASGIASHAEGQKYTVYEPTLGENKTYNLEASGVASHAEGQGTIAAGGASHSEGFNTQALGLRSHTEGGNNIAYSGYSHVEGIGNTAGVDGDQKEDVTSNRAAHAEGCNTKATARGAHSEGLGTIAASDYQHVQGKYNIEDSTGTYLHIVGNGDSDNDRSNAYTLDTDGNAQYAGNVGASGITVDSTTFTSAFQFKITYDDGATQEIKVLGVEV